MAFRPVAIATLFVVCLSFHTTASKQCGSYTYSIFQKMLRGHTFRTIQVRAGSVDCIEACNSDVRCQSLNFVMFEDLCELNNRTKEARPEDFVENMNRYYMMKSSERGVENYKCYNVKKWLLLCILTMFKCIPYPMIVSREKVYQLQIGEFRRRNDFFFNLLFFSSLGDVLSSILCKQNRKEIINLCENDKKTHDL